jgi:large subunit ribosomal protein L13
MEEYTIDAKGKKLGRVATEAARALMGKHRADYAPNKAGDTKVTVTGVNDLSISERKSRSKEYTRYSGYPGGLISERLFEVIEKKGVSEALRRAVYGMLPGNRLRKDRMKRLIIND